jgi:hypothetical protein
VAELVLFRQQTALQLIYDTAPIGLACLSLDCRYLQIISASPRFAGSRWKTISGDL